MEKGSLRESVTWLNNLVTEMSLSISPNVGQMSLGRSLGRKLSNLAYSHGSLKFLSSFNYKKMWFLEFEN